MKCPSPPGPSCRYPSSPVCLFHQGKNTRLRLCKSAALRAAGCNQTLHLYVHHVHCQRHWDKENKHPHTHAHTHTQNPRPRSRHALWSPSVDQNSFLSAFPSKSIPRWSTDIHKCAREASQPSQTHPKHTHAHTHTGSCLLMCDGLCCFLINSLHADWSMHLITGWIGSQGSRWETHRHVGLKDRQARDAQRDKDMSHRQGG